MAKNKTNGNMFGSEHLAAKYEFIVSYSKKLCRKSFQHIAIDIANNAWIKADKNIHAFWGKENQFESWLKRIVYNCFIDETRNNKFVLLKEDNLSNYTQQPLYEKESRDFLDDYEKKTLWNIFKKLTEKEQNLIYCRIIHRLSLRETEEETGIKWGYISNYTNRALKKLNNLYGIKSM